MPEIILLPFHPEEQAAVKRLVLAGLAEHWKEVDPIRNPDLNEIAASYSTATFVVAWTRGQIVGCGAFVPRSEKTAEIVRMSVAADMRSQGFAHRILDRLIEKSRIFGIKKVTLETTATWAGVIEFYLKCGFHITHYQDGNIYFALELL